MQPKPLFYGKRTEFQFLPRLWDGSYPIPYPRPYLGPVKEDILLFANLRTCSMKLFQLQFVIDLVEISRSTTSVLDANKEGTLVLSRRCKEREIIFANS